MPEDLAGKRLLIVEEALTDFVGHWYEYVKSVAELNREAGAEVTIVGHALATQPLRDDLGVVPVFERTLWNGDYHHPRPLIRKLGLFRHNWLVFRHMRALLKARGPFDCTFAPTVVVSHIWAWRLLFTLYPQRIGRLVLLIRNNSATYPPDGGQPQFNAAARLFGWALRAFGPDIAAGRVVLATDSDRLAEEYRTLSGVAPLVFPSPRIAAPPPARTPRAADASIVFGCLGPARIEKGIATLQQAIALYLANPASPPARFVIQWPSPIELDGSPYLPDSKLAASGAVDFVTDPLDSAGYDALLASLDCMVLPYQRQSYYARISGVAVEAVTAGMPIIATEDTWTSRLVAESGAGLEVPDGDAAALASAMARLARDYSAFRAQAEACSADAALINSGDAFQQRLWFDRGTAS